MDKNVRGNIRARKKSPRTYRETSDLGLGGGELFGCDLGAEGFEDDAP